MTDQTFKTFVHDGLISRYVDYSPKNMIAGDTDSCYIDLSSLFDNSTNKEDVVKFADELGEKVNSTFPQFMKDVFNVSEERSVPIQTDREVVSDKSVFFAKKRYVMHVINNEGLDVDKLKIMGLEIKKSDTPIIIQDFLKDIVNMLMERKSYEEVREFIDSFKEYYMKQPIEVIGRPSNIKTLNKYLDKFETQNSFKGFPWHVKASMIYNALCEPKDVKIRAGDKIKTVYVKEKEISAIAFPSDADVLPDFLYEFEIDWKKMWEKIEMKLEIYLKPIGYDKASLQKEIVSAFVEF